MDLGCSHSCWVFIVLFFIFCESVSVLLTDLLSIAPAVPLKGAFLSDWSIFASHILLLVLSLPFLPSFPSLLFISGIFHFPPWVCLSPLLPASLSEVLLPPCPKWLPLESLRVGHFLRGPPRRPDTHTNTAPYDSPGNISQPF